jgi:glycine cleavage system transcriptional repressor
MDQEQYLALSALGPDRPGLVAEATRYLAERGGNVEDSRMAVLGGDFGLLILVSGPPDRIELIQKEIAHLESLTGLQIQIRPTRSPEEHRRASVAPCTITAHALDHEGIVHAVSNALYRSGVNIVSLHTTAYNAPITGSPLFRLEATVDLPRQVSLIDLRRALDEVAREENLDLDVRSQVP